MTPRIGPRIGTAASNGSSSVVVNWVVPKNTSQITRYRVVSNPVTTNQSVNGSGSTSLTFTGLSPEESYRFKVTALNVDVVIGNESEESNSVTPVSSLGIPYLVESNVSNGLCVVTWNEPVDFTGITNYTVNALENNNIAVSKNTTGRTTQLVMTGLLFGRDYSFTVNANGNNEDVGLQSDPTTEKSVDITFSLGTITNVNAIAFDGSANVTWTAPTTSLSILNYTVISNPGTQTLIVENATQINFTDLNNGTAYTFAVKANYGGIDPPDTNFVYSPNSVTPFAKPMNVTATPGFLRANVRWEIQTSTTGIIGYKVNSIPFTLEREAVGPGSRSLYMSGLNASLNYRFTVKAYGASGILGPESNPTTDISGSIATPSAPRNIEIQTGTSSTVHVRWSAPIATTNISNYLVECFRNDSNTILVSQRVLGDKRSTIFLNLVDGATIYFKVYTYVDPEFGPSAASESSRILPAALGPGLIVDVNAVKVTSDTVVCIWSPPNPITGNDIDQYTVYSYKDDSTIPEFTYNTGNAQASSTFGGRTFSPGVYRFSAVSRSGARFGTHSPLSNPLTF